MRRRAMFSCCRLDVFAQARQTNGTHHGSTGLERVRGAIQILHATRRKRRFHVRKIVLASLAKQSNDFMKTIIRQRRT